MPPDKLASLEAPSLNDPPIAGRLNSGLRVSAQGTSEAHRLLDAVPETDQLERSSELVAGNATQLRVGDHHKPDGTRERGDVLVVARFAGYIELFDWFDWFDWSTGSNRSVR